MVISGGVRHQPNEVSNVLCGMPGILSAPWGTLEPSCTLFLRNPSYMSRLLTQLENARYQFGPASAADLTKLLARAARTHFNDTASLIRLHEALLVFRAFPPSPTVLRLTTNLLGTFHLRVDRLRARAADMDDFDPLEVSGIAGTVMQDSISYDLARWLLRRLPGKVEIAWDDFHNEHALAQMVRHLARQQNLQPPVAHYPNRFAPALRPRQVSPLRLPPRPASLAPGKFPALPHPQHPPRARGLLPPRTAPHAQRLLSH